MPIEFKLPELGENIDSAEVVSVQVAEGHVIQAGQTVIELETDKAVVELPSAHAGRVVKVHVHPGDRVAVGAVLLTIEAAPAEATEKVVEAPSRAPAAVPAGVTETPPSPPKPEPALEPQPVPAQKKPLEAEAAVRPVVRPPAPAGPATRRLARELGVDLHQVSGSGPRGRITPQDVHAHVRKLTEAIVEGQLVLPSEPALPDFSQWGPIERQPMSGIRRKTAETVSLAWRMVPQVTQFDLADITELEAARKRYQQRRKEPQPKLTITVLTIKAVVAALKSYPQFNASVDPTAGVLILKKYYHIGVAVDTEHGLIVPVIRNVDQKSVLELAAELEDLAQRARQRRIVLDELRGGTFTITNLGGIAGTAFSPIVLYPQVAILGLGRAAEQYVVRDGRGHARLMLPLCLSYDHRAIDGADGARFVQKVASALSDPVALLLGD